MPLSFARAGSPPPRSMLLQPQSPLKIERVIHEAVTFSNCILWLCLEGSIALGRGLKLAIRDVRMIL